MAGESQTFLEVFVVAAGFFTKVKLMVVGSSRLSVVEKRMVGQNLVLARQILILCENSCVTNKGPKD